MLVLMRLRGGGRACIKLSLCKGKIVLILLGCDKIGLGVALGCFLWIWVDWGIALLRASGTGVSFFSVLSIGTVVRFFPCSLFFLVAPLLLPLALKLFL